MVKWWNVSFNSIFNVHWNDSFEGEQIQPFSNRYLMEFRIMFNVFSL